MAKSNLRIFENPRYPSGLTIDSLELGVPSGLTLDSLELGVHCKEAEYE